MVKVKLSTNQAAKLLGVSTQTVTSYRKRNLLHGVRYTPKGRWKYYLADVLRLRDGDEA